MICNPKMFYWKKNPDWYDYDENDEPYLTDMAPAEAYEAFQIWKEIQKRKAENPERMY